MWSQENMNKSFSRNENYYWIIKEKKRLYSFVWKNEPIICADPLNRFIMATDYEQIFLKKQD